MAKLTKSLVEALEPSKVGVKGSYLFAWDQELRGFGVQVMPSGLKSFILQYRNGEKRSRRIVIGRYGVMTVEGGEYWNQSHRMRGRLESKKVALPDISCRDSCTYRGQEIRSSLVEDDQGDQARPFFWPLPKFCHI